VQKDSSPDLLGRAQAGDGESFWLLCAPIQERLVRQALALCRNEAQAQDLAQETLVQAWKSIERFNRQCQFSTWLCSIMLHRHKSMLRSWNWRAWVNRLVGGEEQTAVANLRDQAPLPDRPADLSDRSHLILKSLDRLPAQQRAVVFLRFYADDSLEEIAAALDCSVGTVKSRLFHGLENLRRMNTLRKEFL
jgi:RNA polymerase sigma-70 factor (ECF subfamily)